MYSHELYYNSLSCRINIPLKVTIYGIKLRTGGRILGKVTSVGIGIPPYEITQNETREFARSLFGNTFRDIDRLLKIFENANIHKRHYCVPIDWFKEQHSFEEKNDLYIKYAVEYGIEAIQDCLKNQSFLNEEVDCNQIDAIIFVSSSGLSTPSIEARIMNELPFLSHTKRIPIWGLGCAGGASGLSRAFEYCKAFPTANVLLLCVELCGLTFQHGDRSKSNLVGTSLFADGAACALIVGEESHIQSSIKRNAPVITHTQSTLMANSEDVMGWNIKNEGLYVVFSKDIPSIIRSWLHENVNTFLQETGEKINEFEGFIAHPGGKKVLEAYETSLQIEKYKLKESQEILQNFGNMSSVTILYVLKKFLEKDMCAGTTCLGMALGPGFSSELLLFKWE
jgi:alkylresorcinol/alkylpyrone synthase